MTIGAVIYFSIGVLTMLGFLVMAWFCTNKITSSDLGLALVMVVLWPVGICCLFVVVLSEDIVLLRRNK